MVHCVAYESDSRFGERPLHLALHYTHNYCHYYVKGTKEPLILLSMAVVVSVAMVGAAALISVIVARPYGFQ